jgi:hypothetical protein
MTAAPVLSITERVRRVEFIRDSRAFARGSETVEQREHERETKADKWSDWLHAKMHESGSANPVAVLPDALARLEQIAEDRIAVAVRDLKTTLMGALK